MKKSLQLLLLFLIAIANNLNSQNISGIVKYKGEINQEHVNDFIEKLRAKKLSAKVTNEVIKMYQDATPDYYALHFKDHESYYFLEPSLDPPNTPYNVGSKSGILPYYTNNETNQIIMMGSDLGNVRIKSNTKWRVTQETHRIGNFLCYQAIGTWQSSNDQGSDVIVWFTPDIPINFGPKAYKDLPGLILKVETDTYVLTATEVTLNPDSKEIRIKKINDDDTILTLEEFNRRASRSRDDF